MPDEKHVMRSLGLLFEQAHALVLSDPALDLRPSQLRVLGMVPASGVTVSHLADLVGMTKQGIGQFVTQLVQSGYLTTEVSREDRRVRMVHRTDRGEEACHELALVMKDLENRWAKQIGVRRYRQFRIVLDEIASRSDD